MSYHPVRCPHCHRDLPLRIYKRVLAAIRVVDAATPILSTKCRRCDCVVELTATDLHLTCAIPEASVV